MRKFTLSVSVAMLALASYAADVNVTVDHQAEQKKVFFTFSDYSVVLPGMYAGNYTCSATLNGGDVTSYIYPMLNEAEDFTNVIYFDYMLYMPALMNDGQLPDGDYTITFNEGFLNYDYTSSNEAPVSVSFNVGQTVGIQAVEASAQTQNYNLMGQKVNGTRGISIVNGKKVMVK